MKNYFFQNQISPLDYVPQGYVISTNYNDRMTCFVPLTDEQEAYLNANPTANAMQVYYCGNVPQPILPTIDPEEQREKAYETEPIIMWDGKLRTCDFCRALIVTYQLLQDTREAELSGLWLQGRLEIQNLYPDAEN